MKEKSRENVYEQLKIDEGVEYKVYLDHLGYKTCGVGHLCVQGDPEMDLGLGAPVPEPRVKELFRIGSGYCYQ
jgi:GH24 family phage-related lysozyme (muramidase)